MTLAYREGHVCSSPIIAQVCASFFPAYSYEFRAVVWHIAMEYGARMRASGQRGGSATH